jgi:chromosome segregation ATPase
VLLNILGVTIFINLANIVPNYRAAYQGEKKQKELAQQEDRWTMGALWTERAGREKDNAASAKEIAGLKRSETALAEQLKVAGLTEVDLRAQVAKQTDLASRAQSSVATQQALNDKLVTQINEQRDEISKKDAEILVLRKAKEEAEAQAAKAEIVLRQAREELIIAGEKIKQLNAQLQKAMSGERVGPVVEVTIDKEAIIGTVTTVDKGLASINIGRAKGVEKGMVFIVHRMGEFVGKLQIDTVELDHAAGIITDKKHEPMVNDKVTNKVP